MPALTTPALPMMVAAVLAYGLGSVSFGLVMARLFGLGDLRKIGSGNIGATNVLRTGNKPAAALTLILDAAKGGIAVLIARATLGEDAAQLAGLAAFLGHCFPIWLGFRGGKGVATCLGVILALSPLLGATVCATWLAVAGLTRYSSLAALLAALLSPVWASFLGRGEMVLVCVGLAALIVIRHRANIQRLLTGTEPKIGQKS
ncbi:MAG: glycerol-3-phosphate 1-O-acyltransferase PlsY [Qingshengfaniella sp.]